MLSSSMNNLIPARFLILLSHLTISIIILWSRDGNVKACLPYDYENEEYTKRDFQLLIGLCLAIGFIGFELLAFISGISMFMPTVSILSIICHASASILLSKSLLDEWDCRIYWWIFTFCSIIPFILEIGVFINVLALQRF
uniref:Transmembrane protein 107 n=1 Tax=Clastoptera arizonana TaxID=38151 RepID=A0A1B6CPB6_9HEMI